MNILTIRLRSLGRRLGIHRLVYNIRARLNPNRSYEDRCSKALQDTILPGDVVWDIGANVGFYTGNFCDLVGPHGHVIAFEPNPQAAAQLEARLGDCKWLSVERLALGERAEEGTFVIAPQITTGHLRYDSETSATNDAQIPIKIVSGDEVCQRLGTRPNVLKIDVEGAEEDVLTGLIKTLEHPDLRAVMTEVHFQQLELRGQPDAPIRIEKLLRRMRFRLTWVDPNHLLAIR